MIRFRCTEDENIYLRMMGQVCRQIAIHLPPDQMAITMRNIGKMQDMLMLEGVRQGVAAAAVGLIHDDHIENNREFLTSMKAFELHASVYGGHDTPLTAVESRKVQEVAEGRVGDLAAWLHPEPMRFAPTVDDLEATTAAPVVAAWAETAPLPSPDATIEDIEAALSGEPVETSPDAIDRIRDCMVGLAKAGVKVRDYSDLVLRIHMSLHMDAGYIDLQLGTDEGRTAMAQAGFMDMAPGPWGLNLQDIAAQSSSDDAT